MARQLDRLPAEHSEPCRKRGQAGPSGALRCHPLPPPDNAEVGRVAGQVARRTVRLLERSGLAPGADPAEADPRTRSRCSACSMQPRWRAASRRAAARASACCASATASTWTIARCRGRAAARVSCPEASNSYRRRSSLGTLVPEILPNRDVRWRSVGIQPGRTLRELRCRSSSFSGSLGAISRPLFERQSRNRRRRCGLPCGRRTRSSPQVQDGVGSRQPFHPAVGGRGSL